MAKSLLLVDDSVAIREVVSLTFESTDLTVRTASNLDEALAALGRDPADIVIADADKAGVGGWELCRRLKEDPRTESIPVLLLSGDDEAAHPLDVAPDALLSKPFGSDELKRIVAALINLDPEGAESDRTPPQDGPIETAESAETGEEHPLDLADLNLAGELESALALEAPPPALRRPDPLPQARANEEPSGAPQPPESPPPPGTVPEAEDLRPVIESAVRQSLSESLQGLNEEALRGLIADAVRDALKDMTPRLAGMVEQVAREVVPTLAEIWIEREIQRLKEED